MLSKKTSVFPKVFWSLLLFSLTAGSAFAAISNSDFIELYMKGSLQEVTDAIESGADVNAVIEGGLTPLILASGNDRLNLDVIKTLIKAGADVNARTDEVWDANGGLSPLMVAMFAESLNLEAIVALIGAGADVNARNKAGWTPLILAAGNANSNPEAIKALIDAGADVNARIKGDKSTPLILAAMRCSNPEVITVLLDSGADAAVKMVITQSRGPEIIKTAMDCAMENENLQNAEILKRLEEETRRAELIAKRDADFLELFETNALADINNAINNGVNVNARDDNERTPLMLAAQGVSNLELISVLINAGADVSMRDENGATTLLFAAGGNPNPEVIKTIVKAGADVNVIDNNGYTPLMLAAFNNNPEVVTTLLELGADPTMKNADGKTAIEFAAANKKLKNTDALKKLEELSYAAGVTP